MLKQIICSSNPIGFPEAIHSSPHFLLFLKSHWGFVSFTYFHTVFQILSVDGQGINDLRIKCYEAWLVNEKNNLDEWISLCVIVYILKILSGLIFLPRLSFSFLWVVSRSLYNMCIWWPSLSSWEISQNRVISLGLCRWAGPTLNRTLVWDDPLSSQPAVLLHAVTTSKYSSVF